MRTLLVCREAPYPPTTGSPLRLWQQVNLLRSLGPVFVFSVGAAIHETTPLIDDWIHIDAADVRTPTLPLPLRALKLIKPTQYPGVGDFSDAAINKRLSAFIEAKQPDVIVLSHWAHAMPQPLRGRKPLIVDLHNIESKLWSDMTSLSRIDKAIRYWRFSRRETQLSEGACATWVTSELDKTLLTERTKRPIAVSVWPNAIDLAYYHPAEMKAAAGSVALKRSFPTLTFVGYMAYGPNHDAAQLLISEILPQIRAHYPELRALIVGKDPRPELIAAAASEPNVVVTGTVADVRPYLALSDIAVIPLMVGGGTRLKLLEAFAARVAVVSTSKGAEGIAERGSDTVAIADTIDEMVREILSLIADDGRRVAQTNRAYNVVESQFSWQSLIKRLPGEIASISGRHPVS